MAYEIINNGQVTPHRLGALLRLVARLPAPDLAQLRDLLQPSVLGGERDAVERVYRAAISLDLIAEQQRSGRTVAQLAVAADAIANESDFRQVLRERLTGVTDGRKANFLLNQIAAWYAAQDERVLSMTQNDVAAAFNAEMYRGVQEKTINSTKLAAWREWSVAIGWGWSSTRDMFIPDAFGRLEAALNQIDIPAREPVEFGRFAQSLTAICPELDGGRLFRQVVAGRVSQGNQLSLMLSTGLRGLHDSGRLKLEWVADAQETWTLYPAIGHPVRDEVTHVSLGASQ